MDDLEGVLHDAHRHHLLAVVAAVHHQRARQPLDDRALRLAEALRLVAAGRVRQVLGKLLLHGDVVLPNHPATLKQTAPVQELLRRNGNNFTDDNAA